MGNITCEEYVINRLKKLDEENMNLKDNLKSLEDDYNIVSIQFMKLKDVISKYFELRSLESGSRYIATKDLNEWSGDSRDIDYLVEVLGLVDECKEEKDGDEESDSRD